MTGTPMELLEGKADFDPSANPEDVNIAVTGGIWDYNNLGQLPHPWNFPHDDFPEYSGLCIYLRHVRGLHMTGMTLKDPMTFAITRLTSAGV